MPTQRLTINSVLGGIQATDHFGKKGEFFESLGIDPEMPLDDSSFRASGILRPTSTEDFTSTEINDAISFIETEPKNAKVYAYLTNGKIVSYNSSLASETLETTITSSTGNGFAYYDNYLYAPKNTDIARFGPLNGSAAVNQTYWTVTLGLAALTNTTYPTIQGELIPNHVCHRHTDNALYICDVRSNKGVLHKIKTSKTTVEGDTNDASALSSLDFGYGQYPTTIASIDTNLVVGLIDGTSTAISQKPFIISIWDTTSDSFLSLAQHEFSDPLVTAVVNDNGVIKVFSGDTTYTRVSRLISNYTLEEIAFYDGTPPPFHGAVSKSGSRLVWGGNISSPETSACVFGLGSKRRDLAMGLHNILNVKNSGSTLNVTALKYVQSGVNERLQPIVAWRSSTDAGINKSSTTYGNSYFRSEVFNIGMPFQVKRVWIPTTIALATNMTIVPKVTVDNQTTEFTLQTIDSTNYPNSSQAVEIVKGNKVPRGKYNFYLELKWTGTALIPVALPIIIDIETETLSIQ